tara:strand:+ start:14340 stop:16085 length:1746 start_codon:yes stop_codon:yes gene_type:complete
MREYLKEYFFILGDYRRKIPILIFYFIASSLLDVIGIGLVATYIPILLNQQDFLPETLINLLNFFKPTEISMSLFLGVIIILVYLIKAFVSYDIQKRIVKFSLEVELYLRERLMNTYLKKPYEFYLNENSSKIVNTIGIFANTFQTSTVSQSLRIISESLVVIGIGISVMILNPYGIISVFLLLGVFFVIYDTTIKHKIIKAGETASAGFGEVIKNINQAIFGIKEIKILNKEAHFADKVKNEVIIVNQARYLQDTLKLIPRYALEFLIVAITLSMAIILDAIGQSTANILTKIGVFVLAGTRILPSANIIVTALNILRAGRYIVKELSRVLEKERYSDHSWKLPHLRKEDRNEESIDWTSSLLYQDISYKYPGQKEYLFEGINLRINKGESIGIIGQSGSGKTTLVNLLLGLLDYDSGMVLIDNKRIDRPDEFIKGKMAYIPQNVFLLDDTIKNNIAFGYEEQEIDPILLSKSIKMARLESVIKDLPDGVMTEIGEHGIRFSGGQKQRVAIARAFYSGREILILDEATSALDNETEKEIVKEIELLKGKFTMIIIAHRLSTLDSCDRIIKIEKGNLRSIE